MKNVSSRIRHLNVYGQKKCLRLFISGVVLLIALFLTPTARAQNEPSSSGESQNGTSTSDDSENEISTADDDVFTLEEVVVSGIRGSLEQSAIDKRDADVILESITAEDLGKFPDNNVVEALQRVTGVTISRNERGEGQDVTIRGFGSQFIKTTANGRNVTGLSLSDMPAELLVGAEVFKSSSAQTMGGAIGGVINIETARPFDLDGRKMVATVKSSYEGLSEKWATSYFGMYSDTFANNKWGAQVSISQQNRNSRTDIGSVDSYLPGQSLSNTDNMGTPFPDDDIQVPLEGFESVFFPRQQVYSVSTSEIERLGATAAVQFAPTPRLVLTLDGLFNETTPEDNVYELSHYFTPDNVTAATLGANNTVVALTTNEYGHTDFVRRINNGKSKMYATGFNADWKSEDERLRLTLDLSSSTSERTQEIGDNAFMVVGYQNVIDWEYTGNGVGTVASVGIPELGILGGTFTDPNFSYSHYMQYGGSGGNKDTNNEVKLDGIYDFGDILLSSLNFGGYLSKKESEGISGQTIGDLMPFNGYRESIDQSVLYVFDAGGDFLGGGSDAPTAWLTYDPEELLAFLESEYSPGLLTPTTGGGPGAAGGGGNWEKGAALYLQANLQGEIASKQWGVNLGVRYNQTEIGQGAFTSSALIDLHSIPGDPTLYEAEYEDGESEEITEGGTFTNILPTFNARLNWTDELIFRLSVSQSKTDPNLGDMSPGLRWNETRPNNLTATAGNPDLEPYLSTNIDVSAEWYYNRGGYMSAAFFSKRVDNYIVNGYAWERYPIGNSSGDFPDGYADVRVSRPRNLEVAKAKGVELSLSHHFFYLPAPWDGFGFIANATFVDCPDTLAPGEDNYERAFALEGVGDSQNLMLYYERGPIGVRASYNYRGDYLSSTFNGHGNEPLFTKGSGQLDLRASYTFNEHFGLTFDGTNVTHETQETYGRYKNQLIAIKDPGYRYTLGLRVAF
jgi:TonB-dependent receptor